MIVERYQDAMANSWDSLVRSSRNGTFLFIRDYMDYHRDRFDDHSLVIRGEGDELLAALPAHRVGDRIVSHDGLTYGGLIFGPGMKTPTVLGAIELVGLYLRERGFKDLEYKTVPSIYHRHLAEEDRYAMFLLGAEVERRDLLAVVPRVDRLPYQSRRDRGVKKARASGVRVCEEPAYSEYWELLARTLRERFQAAPVHSLAEIARLRERFPENIRLFCARSEAGELLAGVVVYESERVAHAQYIAASAAGRTASALDLLFDHLLNDVYRDHPYFDFGASHEDGGRAINVGLIDQKEGFGARAVVHDHYRVDLTKFAPGIITGALR
ncbi:MAG TPA: GNAT family N-acetyltransferase [Gemmataceae bacterium]|nr:GNAT family N-acetyltransferase [Gemmataceae bacterium]